VAGYHAPVSIVKEDNNYPSALAKMCLPTWLVAGRACGPAPRENRGKNSAGHMVSEKVGQTPRGRYEASQIDGRSIWE